MPPAQEDRLSVLSQVIEEVAGVPAADVHPDKQLIDGLGLDSLSMVEIAFTLQKRVDVKIPDEELADVKTVQDLLDLI